MNYTIDSVDSGMKQLHGTIHSTGSLWNNVKWYKLIPSQSFRSKSGAPYCHILTGTRQSPNILVFIFPKSDSWEMKVSYDKLIDLFLVTE